MRPTPLQALALLPIGALGVALSVLYLLGA